MGHARTVTEPWSAVNGGSVRPCDEWDRFLALAASCRLTGIHQTLRRFLCRFDTC